MAPIQVNVKHAGQVHSVQLDTDLPPVVFKENVYQVTGVPVDRMKVMIKGGTLKDDTDWRKVAPKAGQTFMVIGAAGELPKPPAQPIVFLEDLDDAALAKALNFPVGLENLGNTCYMNATLQCMRAIPELQTALASFDGTTGTSGGAGPQGSVVLTRSLKNLLNSMQSTTEAYTPMSFLSVLRQVVPQFGEMVPMGKGVGGYAQQDAEECWTQISNALYALPGIPDDNDPIAPPKKFVEQYMAAEIRREMKCDEAPEEPPTVSFDKILKVECNISITTNFLHTGIKDALDQKIEKVSPSLGRSAIYTQQSRLSRLPTNLTVHMVRFAWKREINKKAKIMRRVKFPLELDIVDLVTDELKSKILPVNEKLKQVERERAERRKVRRKTKAPRLDVPDSYRVNLIMGYGNVPTTIDVPLVESVGQGPAGADLRGSVPVSPEGNAEQAKGVPPTMSAHEEELAHRQREKAELEALIPEDLKKDIGCSATGVYELVGIVTHKGAAADSGHYIGFVKKTMFHKVAYTLGDEPPPAGSLSEDDSGWYKFDDEKVTIFAEDKLPTLEGGGEDASAYVLLYRSRSLA